MSDAPTPETLNAYVDGALTPAESQRVAAVLAADVASEAYVARLQRLNGALRDAYAAPISEPVPQAILSAILAHAPAEGERARSRVMNWIGSLSIRVRWSLAGATGAVAAAAVAAVMVLGNGAPSPRLPVGELANAARPSFDRLSSGETTTMEDGAILQLVASFRLEDGGVCREYEILDNARSALESGLACRRGVTWSVVVSETRPLDAGRDDAVRPAAGDADDPIAEALDRNHAGMAMTADEERAAIEAGWPAH